MKKAIFAFLLSLVPFSLSLAATSPEDQAWLEKTNAAYYCLGCKGLGQFTCLVTPDLKRWKNSDDSEIDGATDRMIPFTKDHFSLTAKADGSAALERAASPLDTLKDPDAARSKEPSEMLMLQVKTGLELWANLVMQPLVSKADLQKDDFTVSKEADGYSVTQKGEGFTGLMHFDPKAVMTGFITKGASGKVKSFDAKYQRTPGGLLLTQLTVTQEGSQVELTYGYQKVGKFMLPNKLQIHHTIADGKSMTYDYALSGFKTTP